MRVITTKIPEVLLIEPKVFRDQRGFFFEAWNEGRFAEMGIGPHFVQDNHSRSLKGVLRGLHYQICQPQGKLVRCVAGEVFDVAVDLRRSSPTFGKWVSFHLSGESRNMIWIPQGFAHGFLVLSEAADILYKTTDFYAPEHERTLLWNDPALAINWPLAGSPTLSAKDTQGARLSQAELFP